MRNEMTKRDVKSSQNYTLIPKRVTVSEPTSSQSLLRKNLKDSDLLSKASTAFTDHPLLDEGVDHNISHTPTTKRIRAVSL